jgi:hypothetical protein
MNARYLGKRLSKVEKLLLPSSDGLITYVELCRSLWRADKEKYKYKRTAQGGHLQHAWFIPQFEREDAARSVSRTISRR